MIESENLEISLKKQCDLLGVSRSGIYYKPLIQDKTDELALKNLIDEQYTQTPFYGSRRMAKELQIQGYLVGRKLIQRLMREMGLEAMYPKPRTSIACPSHKKYPYLLRDLLVTKPNQVWSADITYIRLKNGFVYLVAIMDNFSRRVLSWDLSNTLEESFCLEALDKALSAAVPEIFNTDQGVQFTSNAFTGRLEAKKIQISMDGQGRALDNIFVERLWRSVKYEEVYLKNYSDLFEARKSLSEYFRFYNQKRIHQSLDYQTPEVVYFGSRMVDLNLQPTKKDSPNGEFEAVFSVFSTKKTKTPEFSTYSQLFTKEKEAKRK
jgi:putative transposase